MKIKKLMLLIFCILVGLGIVGMAALLGINAHVKRNAGEHILSVEAAAELTDVDCILVLGCGIWDNDTPSHMLEDRLKRSLELFELGVAPKLLMTGDHGQADYDEVGVMKQWVVDRGIPSTDVFMDHAGFSTYESMYRAKEVFQAKKIVIISQEYHLYRAIYIAEQLGMEAYGVSADYRGYAGQTMRDIREILARVKDFGTCLLGVEPTYLGDAIPIWGDGDVTNDENRDFT